MNITCQIADDLLPLYLENACSEDSRTALEAHMNLCPACREKWERLQNVALTSPQTEEKTISLANCAKKIQRRRLRTAGLVLLLSVVSICILTLCLLAFSDMRLQSNPTVYPVEEGVWNLTAGELETTTDKIGSYTLYTNSTRITVSIPEDAGFTGEILLWNQEDDTGPILYGHMDKDTTTCTFSNLSSANRYRVTCEWETNLPLTISEGRIISFWHSLGTVVKTLLGL